MKKMWIVALMNQSLGERDQYRVMAVGKNVLDESKACNGTDAMKELLRERLEELFNGDIVEYFGSDSGVTQEDVDYCIDELAKGHASNIKNEDFWWGDEEDVVTDIHKMAHTIRCTFCGSTNVEEKYWVNPNTMEIGEWCEDDECWCNDCRDHVRREVQRTEDYEREVADYVADIKTTIEREPTAAYVMRSDTDEDMEIMVTRQDGQTDKLRVMWLSGDQIEREETDVTLHDAVHHVMRFQRLFNGKVKGNCECK